MKSNLLGLIRYGIYFIPFVGRLFTPITKTTKIKIETAIGPKIRNLLFVENTLLFSAFGSIIAITGMSWNDFLLAMMLIFTVFGLLELFMYIAILSMPSKFFRSTKEFVFTFGWILYHEFWFLTLGYSLMRLVLKFV